MLIRSDVYSDREGVLYLYIGLQALLEKPQDTSSSGVASLIEIEQYMKK
jgi:hypothetical protein